MKILYNEICKAPIEEIIEDTENYERISNVHKYSFNDHNTQRNM
jgi:hypothetical protein